MEEKRKKMESEMNLKSKYENPLENYRRKPVENIFANVKKWEKNGLLNEYEKKKAK